MRLNLILLLFLSVLSNAQEGGFNKNYYLNQSMVSVCNDVFEAPNKNIIMVGLTYDTTYSNNSNRLTIICTDSTGNNILFRKDYGNNKFEYLDNILTSRKVFLTNNEFFIYSPAIDSNSVTLSALIKCNFNGDTIWQKRYYVSGGDLIIQGMNKSIDGGFLLTGFLQSPSWNYQNVLLIKTDINGNELWRKNIPSTNGANPVHDGRRLIQDSTSKRIIIAGYQYIGTKVFSSILTLDSLGIKINQTSFSGVFGGVFTDLIQTNDKHFVAVGSKDQGNNLGSSPRYKGHIVKFDLSSSLIWQKETDTLSVYNLFSSINELQNGDLIICGHLDTLQNFNLLPSIRLRVQKLSSNGVLLKKYYTKSNSYLDSRYSKSCNLTNKKGVLLANQFAFSSNPRPYNIIKLDSNFCDTASKVCNPDIGITGYILNKENTIIYPNPTRQHFTISNSLADFFVIENIYGQTLINGNIKEQVNIGELSSGVYTLKLFEANKIIYITKIIKE